MAGLVVTVCLTADFGESVEGALEATLAPFFIDSPDTPADRGMWDSWRIRGGSDGTGFAVIPGCWGDSRLIPDSPDWSGLPRPSAPGVCAGGPRELLDLDSLSAAQERAVGASWDLWKQLSAAYPAVVPLSDFLLKLENEPGKHDPRELLSAYRDQPLIKAYLDHPLSLLKGGLHFPNPREHPVIGFSGDREEYISQYAGKRPPATDVLTADGWWIETSGRAVHATCDPDECPHIEELPPWPGSEPYLSNLPGDTVLVRLRCHC